MEIKYNCSRHFARAHNIDNKQTITTTLKRHVITKLHPPTTDPLGTRRRGVDRTRLPQQMKYRDLEDAAVRGGMVDYLDRQAGFEEEGGSRAPKEVKI